MRATSCITVVLSLVAIGSLGLAATPTRAQAQCVNGAASISPCNPSPVSVASGATGLTQFLPSELYKHGVDFDGDGRVNIWTSIPDALASAAQQLVNKGWQRGARWAYEVQAPRNADCTQGTPEVTRPIGEWLRAGFVPVRGEKLSAAEQAQPASLVQPEGSYGPAFLATKN